ncbi:MAG: protoheme IX farnesyltransferase [Deltaproteobacteria bacterium]|jgi:protoheme IX farnesyltransferase|nr:protoheme IX farnesyltransferase [Deltaproteobacteria bacterium]
MQIMSNTASGFFAMSSLFRLPLAVMVALTAIVGALAGNPASPRLMMWSLAWGIFFLSAACSVLNQVQERTADALMSRTCHRPVASGLVSAHKAGFIGFSLASAGLCLLYAGTGPENALAGLFAMGWYLLVYTPMKRVTPWAIVAGTPCGMLPPLIGWQAATGEFVSPQAFVLALIMFFWQVPHFWLLALPDRHELQMAGFRVLPDALSNQRLFHISLFWVVGLCSATLLLPIVRGVHFPSLQVVIICLALAFVFWSFGCQRQFVLVEKVARQLKFGLHLYLGLLLGTLVLHGLATRFGF